jgi:uncharacterized membrane protein
MSDDPNLGLPASSQPPHKEQPKTLEELIREKAPEVLKALPGDKKQALAVSIETHQFSMRASPLPDPSELAAYNQIIPNGADRILKMAEDQSAHRIDIEKTVIGSQQRQAFCGQAFGLIIGLSGLFSATYAAIHGQPWFGGIIGGTTLVSLVSVFLHTRYSQKRELGQKQEQMQQVERQMRGSKKKNSD